MKVCLTFLLLSLMMSASANTSIESKLNADISSCSDEAGKVAWWLLGVNPTWRMTYNECLRSRLNKVAQKSNKLALLQLKLEEECFQGYSDGSNAHMNLSMSVVHILNKASDSHMQKQRTSRDIEANLENYYEKIAHSEKQIKKLKKIKKNLQK